MVGIRKIYETKEDILFAILIPVYNVEKYIKECIESVLDQTYQNFEIVIVDDGTPDNSGVICDRYALEDSRITVIHQKNMGLIAARQTAVNFAKKRYISKSNVYIVYLDSDDSLKKYALESIVKKIKETKSDMVFYGLERVSEGKTVTEYNKNKEYEGVITDKRILYKKVFGNSEYNPLCRKAVSIDLLPDKEYKDFYSITHAEDLLQSIELYKGCERVSFINESLYNYTINPSSITQSVTSNNFYVDFTVRQMVFRFIERENLFTESDWKEYREYCVSLLVDMIWTIAGFKISIKEKKKYFEDIYNSEYYNMYIKGKDFFNNRIGVKRYIFLMFQNKMILPILIVNRLYQLIFRFKK